MRAIRTVVWTLAAMAAFGAGDRSVPSFRATEPVVGDADDPAIWVCPENPAQSRIIGTDKVAVEKGGGLSVFGVDGKRLQGPLPLDRPNNVDVEQDVQFGGERWDLAVATERGKRRLAIFRIDRKTGELSDATGRTEVFCGEPGESGAPMGIALYKRPRDGALFGIVSRKEGPTRGYLAQYRLEPGPDGRIDATFVRYFGQCLPGGEIEALLVDDALGYVYGAEEKHGIRKYLADPEAPNASQELAVFGKSGFPADREGLALLSTGPKTGYLICSDQRDGGSYLRVYSRDRKGHPELGAILTDADATDGIEATSLRLGGEFAKGVVVMMSSQDRRFKLYRWDDLARAASLPFK